MQRFLSRSSGGICSKRHTEISLGQKMNENGKEAMSYLMSKDANSPLELSSPTHCTWPYSLPLRRAFWASWVMASASSKITSLEPFLGRQVVLSKSFFNLTVTSRPKYTPSHLCHWALAHENSGQSRHLWSHKANTPLLLQLLNEQRSNFCVRFCPLAPSSFFHPESYYSSAASSPPPLLLPVFSSFFPPPS